MVTLRLKSADWEDIALPLGIKAGADVYFEGVPVTFTSNPFMVTFVVPVNRLTYRSEIRTKRLPRTGSK